MVIYHYDVVDYHYDLVDYHGGDYYDHDYEGKDDNEKWTKIMLINITIIHIHIAFLSLV